MLSVSLLLVQLGRSVKGSDSGEENPSSSTGDLLTRIDDASIVLHDSTGSLSSSQNTPGGNCQRAVRGVALSSVLSKTEEIDSSPTGGTRQDEHWVFNAPCSPKKIGACD